MLVIFKIVNSKFTTKFSFLLFSVAKNSFEPEYFYRLSSAKFKICSLFLSLLGSSFRVQRVRENLHSKCLFVKKKTSTRVFVTVFVKICLLLTNTCACQELNNLKLTLKVVIKINNYENTQSEIRIFCLQSKV